MVGGATSATASHVSTPSKLLNVLCVRVCVHVSALVHV
jgi:hypothetical protein